MDIQVKSVDWISGQEISQITLINDKGSQASFLTLGATWQSFLYPQGNGSLKNLVLGHDEAKEYLQNGICAGQTVGRVAGRIKQGRVKIGDKTYQLPVNNNGHTLHGGACGLHRQNWDFEVIEESDQVGVTFRLRAKESVDGFPGDMTITARYTLDNDDRLSLVYDGFDATVDTLFNPTNHVYFNLGDAADLTGHQLFISSENRLETDAQLIPTGRHLPLSDTAYDFREARSVMDAIVKTGGLDDAYVLIQNTDQPIAVLSDEYTGNQVSLYSDRNALVVYSLNWPEEGVKFSRSGGRTNTKHEGLALEAQTLPDAIHHEDFGNIVLKAGQTVSHKITYAFSKLKK